MENSLNQPWSVPPRRVLRQNANLRRPQSGQDNIRYTWAGPIRPDLYSEGLRSLTKSTELNIKLLDQFRQRPKTAQDAFHATLPGCEIKDSHSKPIFGSRTAFGSQATSVSSINDDTSSVASSGFRASTLCYLCSTLEEHQEHLHRTRIPRKFTEKKPRIRYLAPPPKVSRLRRKEKVPKTNYDSRYKIVVWTGDRQGASTNTNVYITLKGDENILPKTKLCRGRNLSSSVVLCRKSKEAFYVQSPYLGELEILSIEIDGLEKKHAWYCEKVEVVCLRTRRHWMFECGDWLSLHHGDFSLRRDLMADLVERKIKEYQLTVVTGKRKLAGTDANIYATFFGTEGSSPKIHLTSNQPKRLFERGSQDVFRVSFKDIGEILTLKVEHDGRGVAAGWFLEKAILQSTQQSSVIYYFLLHGWLARDVGDGHLWREIRAKKKLAREVTAAGRTVHYQVTVKTGDVRYAGTDANVYIIMHGKLGVTKKLFMDDSRDNFERGNTEVFEVRNNVHGNTIIFGAAIAIEEGLIETKPKYCPYAFKSNGSITAKDIAVSYDYQQNSTEWYHAIKIKDYTKVTVEKDTIIINETEDIFRYVYQPVADYTNGEWTFPYFDCGGGDIWMTTYSSPIMALENDKVVFKGVATIDVELTNLDINQCDLPPDEDGQALDVFRGTHNCQATTKCVPLPEGFKSGAYVCECQMGYYFPNTSAGLKAFRGSDIDNFFETFNSTPYTLAQNIPQIIKMSNPFFLHIVCIGGIIVLASNLHLLILRPNAVACMVRNVSFYLGFNIMYGALLLKIWRVSILLTTAHPNPRQMTRIFVFEYCTFIILVAISLAVWNGMEGVSVSLLRTINKKLFYHCQQTEWKYAFKSGMFVLLIACAYLCHTLKKVSTILDEGKYINWAIYNCGLSIIVHEVLSVLVGVVHGPDVLAFIRVAELMCVVPVTILLVFIPKLRPVYVGTSREVQMIARMVNHRLTGAGITSVACQTDETYPPSMHDSKKILSKTDLSFIAKPKTLKAIVKFRAASQAPSETLMEAVVEEAAPVAEVHSTEV